MFSPDFTPLDSHGGKNAEKDSGDPANFYIYTKADPAPNSSH